VAGEGGDSGHVRDAGTAEGESAAQFQRAGLACGAQALVSDPFEIGVMREAEDAAVDLDPAKAQGVAPDLGQKVEPRTLGSERMALILEQAGLLEDA